MSDAEETLTEQRPAAAPAHDGSRAGDEGTAGDGEAADVEETVEGGMTADSEEKAVGGETVDAGETVASRETVGGEGTVGAERNGPRSRLPRAAALAAPTTRTRGGGAWRSTWTPTS
ncbi:hypothetical protein [Streptomyces torulosus]|uniref:hypothetical protein n=1 Tax=Streptomyces torulosus TaxID=68276 RepID=UPI0012FF20DA|nr:hypothetical protein [Streptomyces torulosus]